MRLAEKSPHVEPAGAPVLCAGDDETTDPEGTAAPSDTTALAATETATPRAHTGSPGFELASGVA